MFEMFSNQLLCNKCKRHNCRNSWPLDGNGLKPEPVKKMFLSENVIFLGLRLSLGHFGQQVPESPVSQLQNGVSTSSLPPFIVDLLTFKVYPRSNSFFSMGILEGVKWLISQADYNGPK